MAHACHIAYAEGSNLDIYFSKFFFHLIFMSKLHLFVFNFSWAWLPNIVCAIFVRCSVLSLDMTVQFYKPVWKGRKAQMRDNIA